MMIFQYREMRRGNVPVPIPHRIDFAERWRVCAECEKKLWDEGKKWSIRFGTQFLRVSIMAIDKVRIEIRKLIAKMEDALTKKHARDPQGSASFFLKDIAEHKKKIREKAREKEDASLFVDKI